MESTGIFKGFRFSGPLILAGALLSAWFILKASAPLAHILFLGLFSIVMAAMLDIPISFLTRWMPRWLASLAVLASLILALWGLVALAAPSLVEQSDHILDQTAAAMGRMEAWAKKLSDNPIGDSLGADPRDVTKRLRANLISMIMKAIPLAFGTVVVLAEAFAVLAMATFLVLKPWEYTSGLLRLIPKGREKMVSGMLSEMGLTLRNWSLGTLVSMSIIGVITGLGLFLLGVKGWLPLALLAFFGEFIPFAGPILSAIPALAVGLADSPQTAVYVGILYLATQQIEGNIVQPVVMRNAVQIRPPVLILWQMLFAMGFGFMGLLVATPLLAVLQVAIDRGYIKGTLGR